MADTCRSCGAAVIWAVSTSGKRLPLDAKPITGPVYVLEDHGEEKIANPVRPAPGASVHRSHFETCPDAQRWSKPIAGQMAIE